MHFEFTEMNSFARLEMQKKMILKIKIIAEPVTAMVRNGSSQPYCDTVCEGLLQTNSTGRAC